MESEHYCEMYLNECKLYEDAYSLTMERLSRSVPLASTIEEYNRQFNEHKIHNEQINEKRRRLNLLYDKLDRVTRTRYEKQFRDLEKRSNDLQDKMIEQTIRSEYFLRIWNEYQIRLNDIYCHLDDIEKQLPFDKQLFYFQQIQSTFVFYKVKNKILVFIYTYILQTSLFALIFLGFKATFNFHRTRIITIKR